MAKQAGASLTYQAQYSLVQPDPPCAYADMVLVLGTPQGFSRTLKACGSTTYVVGPDSVTYATKDQLGSSKLFLALPTFPFTGTATPAQAEFQQVMHSLGNQTPGAGESMGWTAAKEFELAAIRAAQNSHEISPRALIAALQTFNNETLGGLSVPLNFGAGHAAPANCWFPMQATGGNWSVLNGGQMACR
jgi:hypothetical protein